MIQRLADESVAIATLISAICVALDLPEKWMNVILALVPLILGFAVRSITTAPTTLANVASDAAQNAAQHLGTSTVGAVGTLTERGLSVATQAASDAVDNVGGLTSRLAGKVLHG